MWHPPARILPTLIESGWSFSGLRVSFSRGCQRSVGYDWERPILQKNLKKLLWATKPRQERVNRAGGAQAFTWTLYTSPIPKGLRPPAQGCEERATLGKIVESAPTLKGLWQARACCDMRMGRNHFDEGQ